MSVRLMSAEGGRLPVKAYLRIAVDLLLLINPLRFLPLRPKLDMQEDDRDGDLMVVKPPLTSAYKLFPRLITNPECNELSRW